MAEYGAAGDIRVGVIGYGPSFNMGRHHLNELIRAGMTPVAMAAIDPARVQAALEEFPQLHGFPCAEAMLDESDVDLVTVITPHNTHADLAMQCLEVGRPVCW